LSFCVAPRHTLSEPPFTAEKTLSGADEVEVLVVLLVVDGTGVGVGVGAGKALSRGAQVHGDWYSGGSRGLMPGVQLCRQLAQYWSFS